MKLNEIIKKHLHAVIKENSRGGNYMFFSNLEQIKRQCELLMEMDKNVLEDLLNNGHDWADDHITVAKENMDQVFDFIMNETERQDLNEDCWKGYKEVGGKIKNGKRVPNCVPTNESEEEEIDESKNSPTNPKLWAAALAWARSRYDVCPSAYCNGAAAKRYKSKGGGWRKKTNEEVNESNKGKNDDVYHKTYTSAINAALDYAEKRGYNYDNEEVAREIGMGPRKPSEGNTNRFSISLKKGEKEQKKSLHIQVYGMKENYELNCYIN